jgi:hypothetical protein
MGNRTGNGIGAIEDIAWTARVMVFGLLVRQRSYPPDMTRTRPVEWMERDALVETSIRMGLNAQDIVIFSTCWPLPIRTTTQVYDIRDRLGLQRLYKKIQKTRSSAHNTNIANVFMKLAGQAMLCGYDVTEVMKDAVPDDRVRFRPDLGLRIQGKYRFFAEVQLSRIQATRWGVKFRNYVRLYEKGYGPFRVLFLVDSPGDIVRLRQYARDILRVKHPNLHLFVFMSLADFRFQRDILTSPVWQGEWTRDRTALIR